MKRKVLLTAALALAVVSMPLASNHAQVVNPSSPYVPSQPGGEIRLTGGSGPALVPTPPTAPAAPAAPAVNPPQPRGLTIELLMSRLAELKAKQDELAKQEAELVEVLKERLADQKERLEKLGVSPEASGRASSREAPKEGEPKTPMIK